MVEETSSELRARIRQFIFVCSRVSSRGTPTRFGRDDQVFTDGLTLLCISAMLMDQRLRQTLGELGHAFIENDLAVEFQHLMFSQPNLDGMAGLFKDEKIGRLVLLQCGWHEDQTTGVEGDQGVQGRGPKFLDHCTFLLGKVIEFFEKFQHRLPGDLLMEGGGLFDAHVFRKVYAKEWEQSILSSPGMAPTFSVTDEYWGALKECHQTKPALFNQLLAVGPMGKASGLLELQLPSDPATYTTALALSVYSTRNGPHTASFFASIKLTLNTNWFGRAASPPRYSFKEQFAHLYEFYTGFVAKPRHQYLLQGEYRHMISQAPSGTFEPLEFQGKEVEDVISEACVTLASGLHPKLLAAIKDPVEKSIVYSLLNALVYLIQSSLVWSAKYPGDFRKSIDTILRTKSIQSDGFFAAFVRFTPFFAMLQGRLPTCDSNEQLQLYVDQEITNILLICYPPDRLIELGLDSKIPKALLECVAYPLRKYKGNPYCQRGGTMHMHPVLQQSMMLSAALHHEQGPAAYKYLFLGMIPEQYLDQRLVALKGTVPPSQDGPFNIMVPGPMASDGVLVYRAARDRYQAEIEMIGTGSFLQLAKAVNDTIIFAGASDQVLREPRPRHPLVAPTPIPERLQLLPLPGAQSPHPNETLPSPEAKSPPIHREETRHVRTESNSSVIRTDETHVPIFPLPEAPRRKNRAVTPRPATSVDQRKAGLQTSAESTSRTTPDHTRSESKSETQRRSTSWCFHSCVGGGRDGSISKPEAITQINRGKGRGKNSRLGFGCERNQKDATQEHRSDNPSYSFGGLPCRNRMHRNRM